MQMFTQFYKDYINKNPIRSKIEGIIEAERKYFASLMPSSRSIRESSSELITTADMSNDFPYMTPMQKTEYNRAVILLEKAYREGMISKDHLEGKILDFGCGFGGSSFFMTRYSDNIDAVDINPEKISQLENIRLFTGNIIKGDGFAHMGKNKNRYDLITAFFLGNYDTPIEFVESFYNGCKNAIKPEGKVVVCSDLLTMDKVREFFDEYNNINSFPELMVSGFERR